MIWLGRAERWIAVAVALVLCGGAVGCRRGEALEDDAPESAPAPVSVKVARARQVTLRPVVGLVGTLVAVPENTVQICARTAGAVVETGSAEGARVARDDLLLRLDDRPAAAARSLAQAEVDEAQAALDLLEHGPLPEAIEAARKEEQKAAVAVKALQAKIDAMAPLVERGEISAVQHRQLQADLEAAAAERDAARARRALLEAGSRPEELAGARARLEAARARLRMTDLSLAFCRIESPIAGLVTEWRVRRGQMVAEGDRIATIVDTSTLFAQAQLPRRALARVARGAPVEVTVGELEAADTGESGGMVLQARVERLAGAARPGSGGVMAWARIDTRQEATGEKASTLAHTLRPGLGCRLTIHLPERPGVVAVPVAAIADRDGTPVLTVIRDNKAYEIEVVLGVRTDEEVAIARGVNAGDLVATEGGYGLPPGCPVRSVLEGAEPSGAATGSATGAEGS